MNELSKNVEVADALERLFVAQQRARTTNSPDAVYKASAEIRLTLSNLISHLDADGLFSGDYINATEPKGRSVVSVAQELSVT